MIRGERWQEVKRVLDEALDQPPAERQAFLLEACGEDRLLRRQVESFLETDEESTDFLVRPIFALRGDVGPGSDDGRRIGPYRLVHELGRGGMGAVWLGERADREIEQRVAVKLLKRGMDSDEIVRRFQAEQQILADLNHPYVARFSDGGTTDDGRPFFVMEYVEGEPIDRYCDVRRLPVRERLKLFRKVCAAVQFAHQNLVVHRDLKPANTLVTEGGTPKLLDFGIAKLLKDDPRCFATASSLGTGPMSLPYASPEQVRGEAITTATDVYSLGVVLYELLTGHRPYRCDFRMPEEVRQVICEQQPEKPSVAVGCFEKARAADGTPRRPTPEAVSRMRDSDPRTLRHHLAGDLDTIVLRALHKEPERRFSSVEQLSEDIRRHLEGLPVRARGDTVLYRSAKFVRRHAWGVATAALVTALILGFAVTMAVQRDRVVRERDRYAAVKEFLVEFLKAPDPSRAKGGQLTVQETLDAAVRRLEEDLHDEPLIRADLLDAIGRVYSNLSLHREARPLLAESLELRRASLGPDHVLVAESLHNLAVTERRLGREEEAEERMREALAIQRQAWPGGHLDLARGLNNLASWLRRRGQLEAAEELAREALEMKRRLVGDEHIDVAVTLNLLATILTDRGEAAEAEELYRRSIAIRRELEGPLDPGLARTLNNLAELLADRDDTGAALPLHRDALDMRRQLYSGDHSALVSSLNNLGLLLATTDQAEEARVLLEEGLAMQRRLGGDGGRATAVVKKNLAVALAAAGDFAACETLVGEALAVLRQPWRIAEATSVRGGCLAGQGRFVEAEPPLLASYRTLAGSDGVRARPIRQARRRLVAAYEAWGREEEADRYREPSAVSTR